MSPALQWRSHWRETHLCLQMSVRSLHSGTGSSGHSVGPRLWVNALSRAGGDEGDCLSETCDSCSCSPHDKSLQRTPRSATNALGYKFEYCIKCINLQAHFYSFSRYVSMHILEYCVRAGTQLADTEQLAPTKLNCVDASRWLTSVPKKTAPERTKQTKAD